MEETANLKSMVRILKKRLVVIFSSMIGVIALVAFFTYFIVEPKYEASTQILVNQTQDNEQPITTVELQSNVELINTYNVIMTSPIILDIVLEETGIDSNISELQSKISVLAEGESQVVTLSVLDEDPSRATDLANTTASVFEQEVSSIMNIDNVSILSEAQLADSSEPVSPNPLLNLLIAAVIGLMLGIGISLFKEFIDQTIKTEQDTEKILGLPILGSISVINQDMNEEKKN